jgi:ADP-ribose pyrophosphatase YjhB (NUDIX family)
VADSGQDFERPFVTVDVVLLTLDGDGVLSVALQPRDKPPFEGVAALTGGFVHVDEDGSPEDAAHRVLLEKTGLDGIYVEQLRTFAGPGRDPRGWSVSIAHLGLVPADRLLAAPRRGFALRRVEDAYGSLAFDHGDIVREAVSRLRGKGAYSTLPARLLPEEFTLEELRAVYSNVMGERLDQSSFRRKVSDLDILEETDRSRTREGRGKGGGGKLFRLRPGASTFDRRI